MVFNQTQNYKACVIMGLKLIMGLKVHSKQLNVLHDCMYDIRIQTMT